MIKKLLPLAFIGLAFAGVLLIGAMGLNWYYNGKKPDQPIAFNHNLHIEKVGLECTHCHQYTDKSPQAGIPSVSICMSCHESAAIDRPEVKKLRVFWERKEPIAWNKVHFQPWHVRFTHKRHIKAGIECTHCHGEVKAMTTVRKVRTLEMGWCVSCHREKKAPTDCLNCHK